MIPRRGSFGALWGEIVDCVLETAVVITAVIDIGARRRSALIGRERGRPIVPLVTRPLSLPAHDQLPV